MPPKNTVRSAGALPSEMGTTPLTASGGFAIAANALSVGAILPHVADGRWPGFASGSWKAIRCANWFCKMDTVDLGCTA